MFPRVAQFKDVAAFRARLGELGLCIPVDDRIISREQGSPLAESFQIGLRTVGNRWAIHPMEGWDGTLDGYPTELTRRRWRRFGESGAKLIWGGEAAAVLPEGRANPNQLLAMKEHGLALCSIREELVESHRAAHGATDDLLIGLQLTHSGRFSRPATEGPRPLIVARNPQLDKKLGHESTPVVDDDYLDRVADAYVSAARVAQDAGYDFVDIKACHSYLLNELLGARERTGKYGGEFSRRMALLRKIVSGVRSACPTLLVGVRLNMFDTVPFQAGTEVGRAMPHELPWRYGFGVNEADPSQFDLAEPIALLKALVTEGVSLVNLTAGSPYYSPHLLRPAAFPPSDGYQPPEDPLVGVARQIEAARECKAAVPELPMVGSGYSYLQEYFPHVAQGVVREGWIDFVGMGRMTLSYPEAPADTLAGAAMARKRICRTFSDCTTAPRNGMASGCYPLDSFYKELPEAEKVKALKDRERAVNGD